MRLSAKYGVSGSYVTHISQFFNSQDGGMDFHKFEILTVVRWRLPLCVLCQLSRRLVIPLPKYRGFFIFMLA